MNIGYDAKRAFNNNTVLGNYSRMLISGQCAIAPHAQIVLYTPRVAAQHKAWAATLPNARIITPQFPYSLCPSLWRTAAESLSIKRHDITLFHGLSHELPLFLPHKVKSIVTMHDLIVWRFPHYFSLPDRLIHKAKQRYACNKATAIVAISEQTKQDLVEIMHVDPSRIEVIYQSCDPIFWQPTSAQQVEQTLQKYKLPAQYVVCVGTVEERKNQLSVIQALQHIPTDIALVMVGRSRGKYGKSVEQAIASLPNSRKVVWLTNASFADFPALYRGAIASIYMSHFEGFGIPVLESLCCGTPVLTSNCSSMPEAGGEAALYASPSDPEAIATQLLRIISDTDLQKNLRQKAEAHCRKFAPQKVANDMHQLYCKLLGTTID